MTTYAHRERVTAHRAGHKSGGLPYPAGMKASAVKVARKEIDRGGMVTNAARELRVSDIMMVNWM